MRFEFLSQLSYIMTHIKHIEKHSSKDVKGANFPMDLKYLKILLDDVFPSKE